LDFHHHGEVNYTEFLAICVDKRLALAKQNLKLAFHHFEEPEKGYITSDSLVECFRREGRHLTKPQVDEIMSQV
jgi:Ca2+-binding EF-hand superfamily protein